MEYMRLYTLPEQNRFCLRAMEAKFVMTGNHRPRDELNDVITPVTRLLSLHGYVVPRPRYILWTHTHVKRRLRYVFSTRRTCHNACDTPSKPMMPRGVAAPAHLPKPYACRATSVTYFEFLHTWSEVCDTPSQPRHTCHNVSNTPTERTHTYYYAVEENKTNVYHLDSISVGCGVMKKDSFKFNFSIFYS